MEMEKPPYVAQQPQLQVQQPQIVMQRTVVSPLGPQSARIKCPSCHAEILSRVEHEPSGKTHMIAVLLCCLIGLGCIPYCVDSCQNANHYCPNCQAYLGTYK